MNITPNQCRAARAFLRWTRNDLAARAKVLPRTIVDFENGHRETKHTTIVTLRVTFEEAGLRFTERGGVEPGES